MNAGAVICADHGHYTLLCVARHDKPENKFTVTCYDSLGSNAKSYAGCSALVDRAMRFAQNFLVAIEHCQKKFISACQVSHSASSLVDCASSCETNINKAMTSDFMSTENMSYFPGARFHDSDVSVKVVSPTGNFWQMCHGENGWTVFICIAPRQWCPENKPVGTVYSWMFCLAQVCLNFPALAPKVDLSRHGVINTCYEFLHTDQNLLPVNHPCAWTLAAVQDAINCIFNVDHASIIHLSGGMMGSSAAVKECLRQESRFHIKAWYEACKFLDSPTSAGAAMICNKGHYMLICITRTHKMENDFTMTCYDSAEESYSTLDAQAIIVSRAQQFAHNYLFVLDLLRSK